MTSTRDSDNALVLVDGFVNVGDLGTTLPTSPTAALAAGLKDVGWLGDAGIGETPSNDKTDVRGINGALIRRVKTNDGRKFTFQALERNATVMGLLRPGSTPATTTGVTTTSVKAYTGTDIRAWVLTEQLAAGDGTTVNRRVAIPKGEATPTGTVTHNHQGLAVVDFEIECFPATDGTLYIDITDNPAEAVA